MNKAPVVVKVLKLSTIRFVLLDSNVYDNADPDAQIFGSSSLGLKIVQVH